MPAVRCSASLMITGPETMAWVTPYDVTPEVGRARDTGTSPVSAKCPYTTTGRGSRDMKIEERLGQWVEIDRAKDATDEITIKFPNSVWAGWSAPVNVKDEELAGFLRSIGWKVTLPQK